LQNVAAQGVVNRVVRGSEDFLAPRQDSLVRNGFGGRLASLASSIAVSNGVAITMAARGAKLCSRAAATMDNNVVKNDQSEGLLH